MAKVLKLHDGLSGEQREAARLETTGCSAAEISRIIGVHPNTVSNWRASPVYQQHCSELMAEMDKETIRQARRTRDKALKALVKGADKMAQMLDDDIMPAEAATMSRAILDIYKTLAAQTGIKEVSGVEHSVAADPRELVVAAVLAIQSDDDDS